MGRYNTCVMGSADGVNNKKLFPMNKQKPGVQGSHGGRGRPSLTLARRVACEGKPGRRELGPQGLQAVVRTLSAHS